MNVPSDLLSRALELPPNARAELAQELLLSLGPGGPEKDEGYDEAWAAEIDRRIRNLEEGRSRLIPWEEVRERIQQSLDRVRHP